MVFCGFLEGDAETESGVQDIYEGLTPVEGRGWTQDWAEREVGQREKSGGNRDLQSPGQHHTSFGVFTAHQSCPVSG